MPGARILLVDDHEIAREGAAALISAQPGWEVCGMAETGRQAIKRATELRPDIIVMDLLMPDLNGLDAARQIKKVLPQTEILVLSGHEDSKLIKPAFDSGIRAYIFKSQARAHLVPAITALLAGKPYLTPRVAEVLFHRLDEQRPADAAKSSRIEPMLTGREREVVQMLAEGRSNKQIAEVLKISIKTVETHRASIMRKLSTENLSDLIRYAIRTKIIEP